MKRAVQNIAHLVTEDVNDTWYVIEEATTDGSSNDAESALGVEPGSLQVVVDAVEKICHLAFGIAREKHGYREHTRAPGTIIDELRELYAFILKHIERDTDFGKMVRKCSRIYDIHDAASLEKDALKIHDILTKTIGHKQAVSPLEARFGIKPGSIDEIGKLANDAFSCLVNPSNREMNAATECLQRMIRFCTPNGPTFRLIAKAINFKTSREMVRHVAEIMVHVGGSRPVDS